MPKSFTWVPWPAEAHARTRRHGMGVFGPEATCEGPASPPERLIECRMGEIVNLRRARKKAERQLAERTARTRNQARRQSPPRPRPPPDRKGRRAMKSPVVKRSIVIAGHKTSVSLEDAFWRGLKEIANGRDMTLSDLVAAIDSERQHGNLSSAIRLFVLDFYRNQLSDHNEGRDGTRGVLIARAASTA